MTEQSFDIHKAAGVIIEGRKLLVARAKGKDVFVAPGGKLEKKETPEHAVVRELGEEFTINVDEDDLSLLGTFNAIAAGSDGKKLRMDVYRVSKYSGDIIPASEIDETAWITSDVPEGMKVGSIFLHDVIPQLKADDLID